MSNWPQRDAAGPGPQWVPTFNFASRSIDPVSFGERFRTAFELLGNKPPKRIIAPPRRSDAAQDNALGGPASLASV